MTWLTDELSINVSISSVRHLCVKQFYGFVKVVVHCIFWHQPIKHDNIVKLAKNGWPSAYNWLKIDGLILQIFCTLSGRTGSVRSITFISLYVVFIGFHNFISICMSSLLHCLHCQFLVRPFFRWRASSPIGPVLHVPLMSGRSEPRNGKGEHQFDMEINMFSKMKVGQLWPTDIQRILVILKMIWFLDHKNTLALSHNATCQAETEHYRFEWFAVFMSI